MWVRNGSPPAVRTHTSVSDAQTAPSSSGTTSYFAMTSRVFGSIWAVPPSYPTHAESATAPRRGSSSRTWPTTLAWRGSMNTTLVSVGQSAISTVSDPARSVQNALRSTDVATEPSDERPSSVLPSPLIVHSIPPDHGRKIWSLRIEPCTGFPAVLLRGSIGSNEFGPAQVQTWLSSAPSRSQEGGPS